MPIVFAKPATPTPTILTFSGTGSIQQAVIPGGVSSIDIKMWGAGGGSAGNSSGGGGQGGGGSSYVGYVNLSAAQTLYNTDSGNLRFAANEADLDWSADVGRGGPTTNTNGNDGKVIISYIA